MPQRLQLRQYYPLILFKKRCTAHLFWIKWKIEDCAFQNSVSESVLQFTNWARLYRSVLKNKPQRQIELRRSVLTRSCAVFLEAGLVYLCILREVKNISMRSVDVDWSFILVRHSVPKLYFWLVVWREIPLQRGEWVGYWYFQGHKYSQLRSL